MLYGIGTDLKISLFNQLFSARYNPYNDPQNRGFQDNGEWPDYHRKWRYRGYRPDPIVGYNDDADPDQGYRRERWSRIRFGGCNERFDWLRSDRWRRVSYAGWTVETQILTDKIFFSKRFQNNSSIFLFLSLFRTLFIVKNLLCMWYSVRNKKFHQCANVS